MAYLWAVNKSNGCQRLLWSGQCEPCICARLGKVLPVGHRGSSSPLFLEYCIGGGAGKLLGGLGCEGRLAEGAASPRSLLTSCLSGLHHCLLFTSHFRMLYCLLWQLILWQSIISSKWPDKYFGTVWSFCESGRVSGFSII